MVSGVAEQLVLADTFALDLAVSIVVGSMVSLDWLRHAHSGWALAVSARSGLIWRAASASALLVCAIAPALQTWRMSGSPLELEWEAISPMVTATHYGHAWLVCMGSLALVVVAAWSNCSGRSFYWLQSAFAWMGITAFALSRSVVSHASAEGDYTVAVLVDSAHLLLACLWVGTVFSAAYVAFSASTETTEDAAEANRWITTLSDTAGWTLLGIVATGMFNIWHTVPSLSLLAGSMYGVTLFVKLSLVGVAAAMGGINRFQILPFLELVPSDEKSLSGDGHRRLIRILRLEGLMLFAALAVAALLGSTEPPGA